MRVVERGSKSQGAPGSIAGATGWGWPQRRLRPGSGRLRPPDAEPQRLDDDDRTCKRLFAQVNHCADDARDPQVQADFLRNAYHDDAVMISRWIEKNVAELAIGRHDGSPLIDRPGQNIGICGSPEPCVEDMNSVGA